MVAQSQFIGQFGSVVADKKLSDIAEIYDGVHQTPHYTDSGVRFVSVEDITDIYASKKFISIEDYSKYKHVPDSGDLIMTRIGTIGMCAVVSKSEPLAYYVSVTLIKPDHSVIDSTYLKYYIESGYGQSELRMRSLLEAFPMKINLNEIGKIAIKVPALDRQRAFVSIVKQADKSKFAGLKSQFIEMFDSRSESFKKYPIADLCHSGNDIKCGPFGTQLKQAEYTNEGVPVWGIPQINSGFSLAPDVFVSEEKAQQLEQFSLVSEDIAMSRKGNVGLCALYPDSFEDGIIASDVVRIRVNKEKILPHFLVYQLHNSYQIRKQILEVSDGTVMAGINVTKMKGIIVYCPPIVAQQGFKTILGQADKSKYLN